MNKIFLITIIAFFSTYFAFTANGGKNKVTKKFSIELLNNPQKISDTIKIKLTNNSMDSLLLFGRLKYSMFLDDSLISEPIRPVVSSLFCKSYKQVPKAADCPVEMAPKSEFVFVLEPRSWHHRVIADGGNLCKLNFLFYSDPYGEMKSISLKLPYIR